MSIQLDFNDPYSKTYGNQYIEKMKYLVKVIMEYETGEDVFNVLNFETGLGKSYTVNRLLNEILNIQSLPGFNKPNDNYLVVKKFNEDSIRSVDFINLLDIHDDAIAITHENWSQWRKKLHKLKDKRIVFISHQRYIKLCENEKIRNAFSEGRKTLIIDEKVNFPIFTFNKKKDAVIYEILPTEMKPTYLKVVKSLGNFIDKQIALKQTNKVFTHKFKLHPATLKNFLREANLALDNYTISNSDHRKVLTEFINEIPYFFENILLYNSGNLSTRNPSHKHWGLKNNIILDASAKIDGVYTCNPNKFKLLNQTRIIDHTESTFNVYNYNSSKSNVINHKANYFNELIDKIINTQQAEDKILLVSHKELAENLHERIIRNHPNVNVWKDKDDKENDPDYDNQSIAISWYGNLIGKNWASDFNKVWLISTPNLPLEHYLVQFLHYSDDKIGNKSTQVYRGKYKNAIFKSIQNGYIAAEMYQALKRIQRNPNPKGEFNLVVQNEDIINAVFSQIKNVNYYGEMKELEFSRQIEEEKQLNKKPDQVDLFIQNLNVIDKGIYKKSEIAERLKIAKLNRVLSDARVKVLLGSRLVINNRTIEIL